MYHANPRLYRFIKNPKLVIISDELHLVWNPHETSSESYESYDEQYRACKPQRSILVLTLPPFLDIIVFFTKAIDIRFGVYTSETIWTRHRGIFGCLLLVFYTSSPLMMVP
jgi:hypothetical protein